MFRFILPKEEQFFDLIESIAGQLGEAYRLFADLVEDYRDVPARVKEIKAVEHAADEYTHETVDRLNKTFVTPIDREDIHQIVISLDDVIDLIDAVVHRMEIYRIDGVTEDFKRLTHLVGKAVDHVSRATSGLRHIRRDASKILQACVEINRIENEGDTAYRRSVGRLFEDASDPIEVIKWKDLYEILEQALDRCEDVANVLEGLVVKHA